MHKTPNILTGRHTALYMVRTPPQRTIRAFTPATGAGGGARAGSACVVSPPLVGPRSATFVSNEINIIHGTLPTLTCGTVARGLQKTEASPLTTPSVCCPRHRRPRERRGLAAARWRRSGRRIASSRAPASPAKRAAGRLEGRRPQERVVTGGAGAERWCGGRAGRTFSPRAKASASCLGCLTVRKSSSKRSVMKPKLYQLYRWWM